MTRQRRRWWSAVVTLAGLVVVGAVQPTTQAGWVLTGGGVVLSTLGVLAARAGGRAVRRAFRDAMTGPAPRPNPQVRRPARRRARPGAPPVVVADRPYQVYREYDRYGRLLYPGITLAGRYRTRRAEHARCDWWWPYVDLRLSWVSEPMPEWQARAWERHMIRTEHPPCNKSQKVPGAFIARTDADLYWWAAQAPAPIA